LVGSTILNLRGKGRTGDDRPMSKLLPYSKSEELQNEVFKRRMLGEAEVLTEEEVVARFPAAEAAEATPRGSDRKTTRSDRNLESDFLSPAMNPMGTPPDQ